MNRIKVCLLIVIYYSFLPSAALSVDTDLTGRQIMELVDENYSFRDEITDVTMILERKGKIVETRQLKVWLLKDKVKGEKTLLKFYKPAALLNTALLSYRDPNGEKNQWLYLPAQRRIRRVPASNKTQSFMSSQYTYEDFEIHNIDDAEYRLLKKETKKETKYYVVESIPKDSDSGYSKLKSWIRIDINFPEKIEYYNKQGDLIKIETFSKIEKIDKWYQASKMEMVEIKSRYRTIMEIRERHLNKNLNEGQFTHKKLEEKTF